MGNCRRNAQWTISNRGKYRIIEDEKTGLLYEQGNAKNLVEKIIWAIDNPQKVLEIRKRAYLNSYNSFTIEKNAEEVLDIIKKSLKEKKQT